MNQEYPHSVQGPIVKRQRPGDIPNKPRIQWPKGNQTATWTNLDQELSFLLTTHLKSPIDHQLSSFCRVIYDVCLEWFGAVTDKKDKTEGKRPNRRQIQKGKLRSEQRMLKRRLKEAPIHERPELQNILNDIQKRILVISRAENQRKHRKKKRQAQRAFYSNPYTFEKKLFVESKSGKLNVPKEELENHLKMTYSDDLNGIPIPSLIDLPKPQDPTVMFEISSIRPAQVVLRAWMGYRISYITTAHESSGNSLSSFSKLGRRLLYNRNGVWPMVFGYQRKCSQKVSQIFAQYPS